MEHVEKINNKYYLESNFIVNNLEKTDTDAVISGVFSTTRMDRSRNIFTAKAFEDFIIMYNDDKSRGSLPCYVNHTNSIVGNVIKSELKFINEQLVGKIKLNLGSQAGRDALWGIENDTFRSFSTSLWIKDMEYDEKTNIDYINGIDITEISIVDYPRHPEALIDLKNSNNSNYKDDNKKLKSQLDTINKELDNKDMIISKLKHELIMKNIYIANELLKNINI